MKTKVFRNFSKDFLFGIYLTIYDSDKCFCDSIRKMRVGGLYGIYNEIVCSGNILSIGYDVCKMKTTFR